jgi:hypothetical protein
MVGEERVGLERSSLSWPFRFALELLLSRYFCRMRWLRLYEVVLVSKDLPLSMASGTRTSVAAMPHKE